MKKLQLNRHDFRNPLRPKRWSEICKMAGVKPKRADMGYPDSITIHVASAKADD